MTKTTPIIKVQREDFDLAKEIETLSCGRGDIGAIVSFTGRCRDEGGRLSALELEHYPGMAEAEIDHIGKMAIERFCLCGLLVIHRYGKLVPGDNIVLVIATSSHRQAAFDGANYLMDFLKTRAPFWKKEHLKNGQTGQWVETKDKDDAALERWNS